MVCKVRSLASIILAAGLVGCEYKTTPFIETAQISTALDLVNEKNEIKPVDFYQDNERINGCLVETEVSRYSVRDGDLFVTSSNKLGMSILWMDEVKEGITKREHVDVFPYHEIDTIRGVLKPQKMYVGDPESRNRYRRDLENVGYGDFFLVRVRKEEENSISRLEGTWFHQPRGYNSKSDDIKAKAYAFPARQGDWKIIFSSETPNGLTDAEAKYQSWVPEALKVE